MKRSADEAFGTGRELWERALVGVACVCNRATTDPASPGGFQPTGRFVVLSATYLAIVIRIVIRPLKDWAVLNHHGKRDFIREWFLAKGREGRSCLPGAWWSK